MELAQLDSVSPESEARLLTSLRVDWIMALLSGLVVIGACLDGWAHFHDKVDTTFFTPWHAVLYSGFFLTAAFLFIVVISNYRRERDWRRAVPAGYGLSLLGIALFAAGGVGDMEWHRLFGIETGVEPLLSPTHLLLAAGMALVASGPFRAAWRRPGMKPAAPWPMLLSLLFTLTIVTFMGQFAHPFIHPWAGETFRPWGDWQLTLIGQVAGVASILLQTALLMGFLLLTIRRWPSLPWGAFSLVFLLNIGLMVLMSDGYRFLPAAALAGVVADTLFVRLRPSAGRPGALHLFAFAVPAALYAFYFLTLWLTEGIWWTIHLWAGCIVLAGVVGWMLSYLVAPPAVPAQVD